MGLMLQYDYGQTPLDAEELEGIKIYSISTKKELDEWEQKNIEDAMIWMTRKKWAAGKIFTEVFIKEVHKRMYGKVWKWAGSVRQTEKNIGVPYYQITTNLRQLLDDALYWFENKVYPSDELALRFKHRLVAIHCFANGNGRHSRLMADIIVEKLYGEPAFTWGIYQTDKSKEAVRKEYIQSLKAADNGAVQSLLTFART